jgi:hypothetical protein
MANGMRSDIESSRYGWATIRLTAIAVRLEFATLYALSDSISEAVRDPPFSSVLPIT